MRLINADAVLQELTFIGGEIAPDDLTCIFRDRIRALPTVCDIDAIRVEIDSLTYYWCEVNPRSVIDDVLQIIDKHTKGG